MTKAKEYIAYKGDRPLGTGTVKELAEGLKRIVRHLIGKRLDLQEYPKKVIYKLKFPI